MYYNEFNDEIQVDIDEIERSLKLIIEPGQITELRALEVSTREGQRPYTVAGYFNDLRKMAEAAAELTPIAKGVYFDLAPKEWTQS